MPVAKQESLLGRLDQAVDKIEPFGLGGMDPVEQSEDQQRGEALCRRRGVEQLRALDADAERHRPGRAVGREVDRA